MRQLVPGNRVFRREDLNDDYLLISYGDVKFRVRSTIWYEVDYEGFDVGDHVEIKSRMGQADPFIGRIKDMIWNHRYKQIEYYLYRNEAIQVRAYEAADLTSAEAIKPNGDGQDAASGPGHVTGG